MDNEYSTNGDDTGQKETAETKRRAANTAIEQTKSSKGKGQRPNDVLEKKGLNSDSLKQELRRELKRELRKELIRELRPYLKKEI